MAPKFPKPKDEGWFLILGDVENRELLALKRVPFVGARANQSLAFQTPEEVSSQISFLFLSDINSVQCTEEGEI